MVLIFNGLIDLPLNEFLFMFVLFQVIYTIFILAEMRSIKNGKKTLGQQISDIKEMLQSYTKKEIVLWTSEQLRVGVSESAIKEILYKIGFTNADEIIENARRITD